MKIKLSLQMCKTLDKKEKNIMISQKNALYIKKI